MTSMIGSGTLRADGEDICKIAYHITVRASGALKSANGTFRAEPDAFMAAVSARETTIIRDDNGYEMSVILTNVSPDGSGTLAVNGSPGPIG